MPSVRAMTDTDNKMTSLALHGVTAPSQVSKPVGGLVGASEESGSLTPMLKPISGLSEFLSDYIDSKNQFESKLRSALKEARQAATSMEAMQTAETHRKERATELKEAATEAIRSTLSKDDSVDKVENFGICEASFPKESSLSLQITASQQFSDNPTMQRTITSRYNGDFSFTITSNKNYIDFYDTYPSSTINNNFMSRWAMYANTPMEGGIKDQLYPPMKAKLQGLSQKEAVQQLMWWIHGAIDTEGKIKNANCFLYNYDDNVWGYDRNFFAEETLFYPYCDCEDRSILLSHLVRDLLDLDVVLVYYPGHLAMAVNFTEPVKGDYVMLDGRKFIVCDPTYIGCHVGETMAGMEDQPVTAILLNRL